MLSFEMASRRGLAGADSYSSMHTIHILMVLLIESTSRLQECPPFYHQADFPQTTHGLGGLNLVPRSAITMMFADGAREARSRSEEEAMW